LDFKPPSKPLPEHPPNQTTAQKLTMPSTKPDAAQVNPQPAPHIGLQSTAQTSTNVVSQANRPKHRRNHLPIVTQSIADARSSN
jgi:hypothetical protein